MSIKPFKKCFACSYYCQLPEKSQIKFSLIHKTQPVSKIILITDNPVFWKFKQFIEKVFRNTPAATIDCFSLSECRSIRSREKYLSELRYCCEQSGIDFSQFKNKILLLSGSNAKRFFGFPSKINFSVIKDASTGNKLITLPLIKIFVQDFSANMLKLLNAINDHEATLTPEITKDVSVLSELLKPEHSEICLDIETESTLNPYLPFKITLIGLTSNLLAPKVLLLYAPSLSEKVKAQLKQLLVSSKTFIGYNISFDLIHLYRWLEIPVAQFQRSRWEDVMLQAYCINEEAKINIGSHSLKAIANAELQVNTLEYLSPFKKYLQALKHWREIKEKWETSSTQPFTKKIIKLQEKLKTAELQLQLAEQKLDVYNSEDVFYTWLLYQRFKWIKETHKKLYAWLKTLLKTTVEIVDNGIAMSKEKLTQLKEKFTQQLTSAEQHLRKITGNSKLNPKSEKQISEWLISQKIKGAEFTKTGQIILNGTAINKYRSLNPHLTEFFNYYEVYNTAVKALTTYISTFEKFSNSLSDIFFYYGGYSVIGTETGRISSKGLLQQIPAKGPLSEITNCLCSRWGKNGLLLQMDYKQQELRLAAMIAGDNALLKECFEGDVYKTFAGFLFSKSSEKITPQEREKGKAAVLGMLYGMTEYGMRRLMPTLELEDLRTAIQQFYKKFSDYSRWRDSVKNQIQTQFQIEYGPGRIRRFPQFIFPELIQHRLKFALLNAGVNAPIQGTASDITLLNCYRFLRLCERRGLKTKIINTVHDSVFFDIPLEELKVIIPIIQEVFSFIPRAWVKISRPAVMEWKQLTKYSKISLER